jgi:hypothetical protein
MKQNIVVITNDLQGLYVIQEVGGQGGCSQTREELD